MKNYQGQTINQCMFHYKVLVVATSEKAKGGINAVIKAYSSSQFWNKWQCHWIQTHIDRNFLIKFYWFLKSFIEFIIIIPSYQLVHIHFSEPPSALRKSFFLLVSRLYNKEIIVHFHSFSRVTTIDGKFRRIYKLIFNKAHKILVLSNYWKDILLEKWPTLIDKVEVLYNPCPSVKIKPIQRTNTILFAGTLSERKGYHDLLNGFSKIADKHNSWKLIFAGNGELEKARQLAKTLALDDRVEFKGWVEGKEKELLFYEASIFCLPSYAEGFPMAVLEAWAYGLPVITTLVGGLKDIVIDGKNAVVINSGDSLKLSEALDILIDNKELQKKLSKESIKISNNLFGLSKITKQLDRIYSDLLRVT